MSATLRRARADDFPAIRTLIRLGGINPLGLHWSRFWVVVGAEDRVLACGQIKPHRDGTHELASIAVHPAARGQGLARRVIEQLLAESPFPLYLTCRNSLGRLYRKFGFRKVSGSELPPYYRLASWLVNGMYRLGMVREPLLVMRREPDERPEQTEQGK